MLLTTEMDFTAELLCLPCMMVNFYYYFGVFIIQLMQKYKPSSAH